MPKKRTSETPAPPVKNTPSKSTARQKSSRSRGVRAIGISGFDFDALNQRYRATPANDANNYGVTIQPANVAPGAAYWKAIGVYHLSPDENRGRHNIFVDVLNNGGQRSREVTIGWTWDGNGEPHKVNQLDKPDNEPATDIPIFGSVFRLWVAGGEASEIVTGIHAQHADERNGAGEPLNSTGHHSFYVVFQRVQSGSQVTTVKPETTSTNGSTPQPAQPVFPTLSGRIQAREKLGIDANQPIDSSTRTIAPQVANPDIIADTGVGWVRLNFVLGLDFVDQYRQIIAGFRRRGLRIYGLIHSQAMDDPGEQFRDAIAGGLSNDWIGRYADVFVRIVELFHQDVAIFESFNEPDDWHGSNRNWVHPSWFALMLHEIHKRVRSHPNPAVRNVRLVSGPVQGLHNNNNAGADYLRQTYGFGKKNLGWGSSAPFPFDGIGYHLYIAQGGHNSNDDIQRDYRGYLDQVRQVVRNAEGVEKAIYLSEFGWQTQHVGEARQAECLNIGTRLVLQDPTVALGFWFCTQDFPGEDFGLYRQGSLAPENRKPVYEALRTLCSTTVDLPSAPTGQSTLSQPVTAQPQTATATQSAVQWVGVVTTTELYVRSGPGQQHAKLSSLSLNQEVQVVGEIDGWLQVLWNGATAFVSGDYVRNRDSVVVTQSSGGGVIDLWNRYRAQIEAESTRLGIDPALAVAVLMAESNGAAFGDKGRMTIAFENHIFYHYWGKQNEARFRQHFRFNPDPKQAWTDQFWRTDANGAWQANHSGQANEWQLFEFAHSLDPASAMLSISMGAPQIMGFNYATLGYGTVQEMFDAFQRGAEGQINGFFRFVEGKRLVEVLRRRDLRGFAAVYNGSGQVDSYASIIQRHLDAFLAQVGGVTRSLAAAQALESIAATTLPVVGLSEGWQQHLLGGLTESRALLTRVLQSLTVRSAEEAIHAAQLGIVLHSYWAQLAWIDNAQSAQTIVPSATGEALSQLRALAGSASAETQAPSEGRDSQVFLPIVTFPETLPQGESAGGRSPRRRALCIGIDEYVQSPLNGCVADAKLWAATLEKLGFAEPQLLLNQQATRQAILQEVEKLVRSSQPGDVVVIQYAGHGTQLSDSSSDEGDGDSPSQDEALVPYDFTTGAFVLDDELGAIFSMISAGVNVTCFMDCCHSGSISRVILRPGEHARFLVADAALLAAHRQFRKALGDSRTFGKRTIESMTEVVYSACQSSELAWENEGHGEFTLRAVQLLSGSAGTVGHEDFMLKLTDAFGESPRQHPLLECATAGRSRKLLSSLGV